jgi:putative transposase
MNCPHRPAAATKEQQKKTTLGYPTFRCSACRHTFDDRTGSPFALLEYPH